MKCQVEKTSTYKIREYSCGESAYRRTKRVSIIKAIAESHLKCDICLKKMIKGNCAVTMDTSDGEYGDATICLDCIQHNVKCL